MCERLKERLIFLNKISTELPFKVLSHGNHDKAYIPSIDKLYNHPIHTSTDSDSVSEEEAILL